jgi:hypothetical protein
MQNDIRFLSEKFEREEENVRKKIHGLASGLAYEKLSTMPGHTTYPPVMNTPYGGPAAGLPTYVAATTLQHALDLKSAMEVYAGDVINEENALVTRMDGIMETNIQKAKKKDDSSFLAHVRKFFHFGGAKIAILVGEAIGAVIAPEAIPAIAAISQGAGAVSDIVGSILDDKGGVNLSNVMRAVGNSGLIEAANEAKALGLPTADITNILHAIDMNVLTSPMHHAAILGTSSTEDGILGVGRVEIYENDLESSYIFLFAEQEQSLPTPVTRAATIEVAISDSKQLKISFMNGTKIIPGNFELFSVGHSPMHYSQLVPMLGQSFYSGNTIDQGVESVTKFLLFATTMDVLPPIARLVPFVTKNIPDFFNTSNPNYSGKMANAMSSLGF